jgi:hypothetical protein
MEQLKIRCLNIVNKYKKYYSFILSLDDKNDLNKKSTLITK